MPALSPSDRFHPIPPPSHLRQYRAIGLVYGQYYPSGESVTRGVLSTEEGTLVEAVLLGRMLALVKNHLNLNQPHLWVVYPRMRDQDDHLHFQLAGVWEPETLHPHLSPSALPHLPKNQFSIRGEVVFANREQQSVILKIRQSPRATPQNPQGLGRPKSFKVKLQGLLSERPLGHFWDLQVQLVKDHLVIQSGQDLGFVITKKIRPTSPERRKPLLTKDLSARRPPPRRSPPLPSPERITSNTPIPKPIKRDKSL